MSTLTPGLLQRMDAYWRAANHLSVGQIVLNDPNRFHVVMDTIDRLPPPKRQP
jgi:phosphoketolase